MVTTLNADVSVSRDGASLNLPNVTAIDLGTGGVHMFSVSGVATLSMASLSTVNPGAGRVTLAANEGGTLNLDVLETLPGSTSISMGGGVLNAPELTTHGGDIFVFTFGQSGNSEINAPMLNSVGEIRVQGVGADVALPSVTEILDRVNAGGGGTITLAGLEALTADVSASGTGSAISLPALTAAVDSSVNIGTGGVFVAEALESFTGGHIDFDFDTSILTIPNVSNVDNTSFRLLRGAVLSLPNVTSYTLTETISPLIDVIGPVSVLDLSGLTMLTVNEASNGTIVIQARSGGGLDLSGLSTIDSVSTGTTSFVANGTNSQIDLGGLTAFDDTRVQFTEQSGGVVTLPAK